MTIPLGTTFSGKPFELPLDIATESTSIIARKGMGKTFCGRKILEGLLDNHVQTVVIDPLDVWWGVRSSKDGKHSGHDVIIFGGSHADLPLTETSGKLLADTVVDHGLSAVLVTDQLSIAASRRFVADFGERLYDRKGEQKHRTPLCAIIDEADRFAPQQVTPDATRCTGVIDELARRARSRGLGILAISQRPACLNKNVLTQTEVLICLQVNAPQDRKALESWIDAQADSDQSEKFMKSLASFQRGEAWVWSPSKLKVFDQVRIGDVRTYDSSYTPKVGEKRAIDPTLKKVDLEALRTQLAVTIKQAEESDPTLLKREIARLKKELAAKPTAKADPNITFAAVANAEKRWLAVQKHERDALRQDLIKAINNVFQIASVPVAAREAPTPAPLRKQQALLHVSKVMEEVYNRRAAEHSVESGPAFGKAERLILRTLVQYPQGRTKVQAAILNGYAHAGGAYQNAISSLRTRGFITVQGDLMQATGIGIAGAGNVPALPTGEELQRHWLGHLGKAERSVLKVLLDNYPQELVKEDLATRAGYAGGGNFENALSRLRTLELVERMPDKTVRASRILMGEDE